VSNTAILSPRHQLSSHFVSPVKSAAFLPPGEQKSARILAKNQADISEQ
jgi:hypothetical protein